MIGLIGCIGSALLKRSRGLWDRIQTDPTSGDCYAKFSPSHMCFDDYRSTESPHPQVLTTSNNNVLFSIVLKILSVKSQRILLFGRKVFEFTFDAFGMTMLFPGTIWTYFFLTTKTVHILEFLKSITLAIRFRDHLLRMIFVQSSTDAIEGLGLFLIRLRFYSPTFPEYTCQPNEQEFVIL
jgi:hypothetical protein